MRFFIQTTGVHIITRQQYFDVLVSTSVHQATVLQSVQQHKPTQTVRQSVIKLNCKCICTNVNTNTTVDECTCTAITAASSVAALSRRRRRQSSAEMCSNRCDIDSWLWMRRIASEIMALTSTVRILLHCIFCASCGTVFVTTICRHKDESRST